MAWAKEIHDGPPKQLMKPLNNFARRQQWTQSFIDSSTSLLESVPRKVKLTNFNENMEGIDVIDLDVDEDSPDEWIMLLMHKGCRFTFYYRGSVVSADRVRLAVTPQ